MLRAGDRVDVLIEKAAAGGRMIARHDGQIVLVSGAIPGERVSIRVERVEKRLAFGETIDVLAPSPDRREGSDPACGGCLFNHISIERQRALKGDIIADALARIGRHTLAEPVVVAPSPAVGYRMRARLHVRDGRTGFYREGTHELCDAAATGQLHAATLPAIAGVVDSLIGQGLEPTSVEVAESIDASQRALLVELAGARAVDGQALERLLGDEVQSIAVLSRRGSRTDAGAGTIVEALGVLTSGRCAGELRRRPESFFQGNRFLIGALVAAVAGHVLPEGDVLDLYAGVGLFALTIGEARPVIAVEGHPGSGADLVRNARATDHVTAVVSSVEDYVDGIASWPPTVIVDPPRTGLSREVLAALAAGTPRRLVYVSCDPATLARDARRLLDAGYEMGSVAGFDLFPNTPHVESLVVFEHK